MRSIGLFTIFSFSLVSLAVSAFAKPAPGNLMGFVYGEDGKTPVRDAMVLIRRVDTGKVYQSKPTGELGTYRLLGIEAGTYVVGLKIKEKSYNANKHVKVAAGKTSFVSISLQTAYLDVTYKPSDKEGGEDKKKKGFFETPGGRATVFGGISLAMWGYLTELGDEKGSSPTEL